MIVKLRERVPKLLDEKVEKQQKQNSIKYNKAVSRLSQLGLVDDNGVVIKNVDKAIKTHLSFMMQYKSKIFNLAFSLPKTRLVPVPTVVRLMFHIIRVQHGHQEIIDGLRKVRKCLLPLIPHGRRLTKNDIIWTVSLLIKQEAKKAKLVSLVFSDCGGEFFKYYRKEVIV